MVCAKAVETMPREQKRAASRIRAFVKQRIIETYGEYNLIAFTIYISRSDTLK